MGQEKALLVVTPVKAWPEGSCLWVYKMNQTTEGYKFVTILKLSSFGKLVGPLCAQGFESVAQSTRHDSCEC